MKTIIMFLFMVALAMPVIGLTQPQSAAPRTSLTITSSAFSEGGKISKEVYVRRFQREPAAAHRKCAAKRQERGLDRGRSGCARPDLDSLARLEHRSACKRHSREECAAKCCPRDERLRQRELRRTLSTLWNASILLQSLRARYHPIAFQFDEEGGFGKSDGRSHRRRRKLDGDLLARALSAAENHEPGGLLPLVNKGLLFRHRGIAGGGGERFAILGQFRPLGGNEFAFAFVRDFDSAWIDPLAGCRRAFRHARSFLGIIFAVEFQVEPSLGGRSDEG